MADNTNTQDQQQTPKPYPGLKSLGRLVGTWKVSGPDIQGHVTFEWMEGGFFLMQHVDFEHGGHKIKGVEIIGYQREFGATEPSENIKSRWFDNAGNTFDYTYEVDGHTLTIWGGEKGSPAYYQGQWSDDGNTNSGAWHYPGGGGYISAMTRVKYFRGGAGRHKQGETPMTAKQREQQKSDLPIELAQPARRALNQAGYWRLKQLTKLSEAEVKQLHGMGPKALDQLRRALRAKGLSFAAEKRNKGK